MGDCSLSSCSTPFVDRNPLYLGVIFVLYLLAKALWVQLDVSGQFSNGLVSFESNLCCVGPYFSALLVLVFTAWNYLCHLQMHFSVLFQNL